MTADGVSGSDDVMLAATVEGVMLSGGEEGSKSADVSVGARISRASEVVIGSSITSDEERGVASGEEGVTCVEAGRGAASGEEGMGVAKGEEGGNVTETDVNEVAGWSNNVSTLLLGKKKSSVATGVAVGVATSKDSDCEVLKKSSVIGGVEVRDGCICDVLTMKKKPSVSGVAVAVSSSNGCVCEELEGKESCVTDCVEVGTGVTASLEGTVGGEMEGVGCSGIRVGVVMSGRRKEVPPRTEVSGEKVGEKSRVRSSSGIVVEGWMGMSAVKGDEGEGRRVGEREGVEGNSVVRGSRLISLDKNGRRKSLDGDGVGEMEGGKEAAAVGVADGNGMKSIVESGGSRTSSAVVNNISMGTGERTGDVITGDGSGGNKVDAVVSIAGEVTSGSAVAVSKKKSSLNAESS